MVPRVSLSLPSQGRESLRGDSLFEKLLFRVPFSILNRLVDARKQWESLLLASDEFLFLTTPGSDEGNENIIQPTSLEELDEAVINDLIVAVVDEYGDNRYPFEQLHFYSSGGYIPIQ